MAGFLQALAVGLAVSGGLLVAGIALFVPTSKLDNRAAAPVLINPNFSVLDEGSNGSSVAIGVCEKLSPTKPMDDITSILQESVVCRDWHEVERGWAGILWRATKYHSLPWMPRRTSGASRKDALEYMFGVPTGLILDLVRPVLVLLVLQAGVSTGFAYLHRSRSKKG